MNATDITAFPELPADLLQTTPVDLAQAVTPELLKSAEMDDLRELAIEESRLLQVRQQFSVEAARADHATECSKLRSELSPENIAKLKNLATCDDRIRAYQQNFKDFDGTLKRLRQTALSAFKTITQRLIARLLYMGEEAKTKEFALYESVQIPGPSSSRLMEHFVRAAQDLQHQLNFEERTGHGVTFESFLNKLRIKP